AGDVSVIVTNGGIFNSRGSTPASVLSEDQIKEVWNNLHLLDSSYATSANPSVASYQNQVNVNYLQYWELLHNGTVQNGTYTLNSTGDAGDAALQLFRPRTAAALGVDQPSNQQIENYAAGVYQETVKFFDLNYNKLYWSLRANGTVLPSGTFTLNASAIATFRPQAATDLGITNPTDAQVQTWADGKYQAFVADQNPDRSWMNLHDFALSMQTGNTTEDSAVVTGLNTTGLFTGMSVTDAGTPPAIPAGATIAHIDNSGQVTL